MKKKLLSAMALSASILIGVAAQADAETVLYVPQDDRPVSLKYTVETAEAAGYTVITPPKQLISGKNYHGQVDQIWQWVEQNAYRADVMVLSTDTLVYGGLVDSRKHDLDQATLDNRVRRIRALKERTGNTPMYGFGTVMRSPRASGGGTEPGYYGDYGPKIFQIAALQDKMDGGQLTKEEAQQLFALQSQVPMEYLQDWFNRRSKNMKVNKELIDQARNHVFKYFALGHDDTSQLSQSAMEGRYLRDYAKDIPLTEYGSFPGADQLGLLLMARARVDKSAVKPTFQVIYPLGGGANTIPHYEDQTIGKTVEDHVIAVGGTMTTQGKPDVLLAVNTPLSTTTGESEAFENFPMESRSTTDFVNRIQGALDQGVSVSVADIAYSNGSDNTLVGAMYKRDMLYKLSAYNGWNTASNTVGYAIAQGLLAKTMPAQYHKNMLTQQYLDNWAYQANIRKDIYRMQDTIRTDNVRYSGDLNSKLQEYLGERIQDFAAKYLKVEPQTVDAGFPWGRLFETDITVYDSPQARNYKEERLRREAKSKAEAVLTQLQAQASSYRGANKPIPADLQAKLVVAEANVTRAANGEALVDLATVAPAPTAEANSTGMIPVTKDQ